MGKLHYGTMGVLAVAMSRQQYNDYRGWDLPSDEDGGDPGFLVERLEDGTQNHPDHGGYISWSPSELFHQVYEPASSMSFEHALTAMKDGFKVARSGWHGDGMWIAITPGSLLPAGMAREGHAVHHRAQEVSNPNVVIPLRSRIDMRAEDGSMVVGWLASQTDMLADDWHIVEGV